MQTFKANGKMIQVRALRDGCYEIYLRDVNGCLVERVWKQYIQQDIRFSAEEKQIISGLMEKEQTP